GTTAASDSNPDRHKQLHTSVLVSGPSGGRVYLLRGSSIYPNARRAGPMGRFETEASGVRPDFSQNRALEIQSDFGDADPKRTSHSSKPRDRIQDGWKRRNFACGG